MKKFVWTVVAAGLAVAAAGQDEGRGGWRLTLGPSVEFGVKSRVALDAGRAVGALGGASGGGGASKDAAQRRGDALRLGAGRVDFGNGAFIDPEDSAGREGETWNWRVPSGALGADGTMTLSHPYSTKSVSENWSAVSGGGREAAPGLVLGLERTLWRRAGWGVDAGLSLSHYARDGFAKVGGTAWTREERTAGGRYVTEVSFDPSLMEDPWAKNPDGSYGSGRFDGPGIVLEDGDVEITHHWSGEKSGSKTTALTLRGEGDWRETEVALAARPWFEPAEWFRVHGILGVAASYARAEFEVRGSAPGASYASKETFDDWGVHGILGAGLLFRCGRWCFGIDATARPGAGDVKLDGKDVKGKVERAPVAASAYLGIEW